MKKRINDKYMWSLNRPMYLNKKDKGYDKYCKQLKSRGFSDTETWGLDSCIAKFILPRLIRFKKLSNGHPMDLTPEEWDVILDDIIWSFNYINNKYDNYNLDVKKQKEYYKKYKKGMNLFKEYLLDLWW